MSSEDRGVDTVDVTTCLPPCEELRDLLSIGVCLGCILRLFGRPYSSSLLSSPSLFSTLESTLKQHTDSNPNSPFCCICLGILQFNQDPLTTFTASIADTIKPHHHDFTSFSLDITVPSIVSANERAICSYMDARYKSHPKLEPISVRQALQFSITTFLETLLDAKFGFHSSFHITLTYTHAKPSIPIPDQDSKRMKIDPLAPPLEKVTQPCSLACGCYRQPVYICGRYLKFSRNVSQTRWIIDDERKGEASVEEIIGNAMLPFCRADDYKFHAAGREDIDVRMLGSGRPFLIEIQNSRSDPSKLSIQQIENEINNLEAKLVRVKNSKVVGIEGWNLMRQGEAEKQKQYAALVWVSTPLKDEHLQTIASLENMKISQRTPIRVLHRRSPLDRERIIHSMKIERIVGSTHYFLLHLCTQAGTYIKEFVHGDLGRTHPSIGSILGCRAEILQLDVTDVKMNCFI